MTDIRDEFRRFALDLYGSAGVARAALLLQDRRGVDVNVLLFAAYVGAARGSTLSTSDFDAIRERTSQWQHDVVSPLRTLRKRLVDGPLPAPNPSTAALRDRVKALELDAELIELDELADLVAHRCAAAPPSAPAPEQAAIALRQAVADGSTHELSDDERAAISVIASAATAMRA